MFNVECVIFYSKCAILFVDLYINFILYLKKESHRNKDDKEIKI